MSRFSSLLVNPVISPAHLNVTQTFFNWSNVNIWAATDWSVAQPLRSDQFDGKPSSLHTHDTHRQVQSHTMKILRGSSFEHWYIDSVLICGSIFAIFQVRKHSKLYACKRITGKLSENTVFHTIFRRKVWYWNASSSPKRYSTISYLCQVS